MPVQDLICMIYFINNILPCKYSSLFNAFYLNIDSVWKFDYNKHRPKLLCLKTVMTIVTLQEDMGLYSFEFFLRQLIAYKIILQ